MPDPHGDAAGAAANGPRRRTGDRLYRFHWREAVGKRKIVRWRQERLVPAGARDVAVQLAAVALSGAVRVALIGPDGRTERCVVTNAGAIGSWQPGRALPAAAGSDWTAEHARRNSRVHTFGRLRALLWDAEARGLLGLRDAASIAHAVSLALDGAGPFVAHADG